MLHTRWRALNLRWFRRFFSWMRFRRTSSCSASVISRPSERCCSIIHQLDCHRIEDASTAWTIFTWDIPHQNCRSSAASNSSDRHVLGRMHVSNKQICMTVTMQ